MSLYDCAVVPDRITAFRTTDTMPIHFAATVDTFVPRSRSGDLTYENTRARDWNPHNFGQFAVRPGPLDAWYGFSGPRDVMYFYHESPDAVAEFRRLSEHLVVPYASTDLMLKWEWGEPRQRPSASFDLGVSYDLASGRYGIRLFSYRKPADVASAEEAQFMRRQFDALNLGRVAEVVDDPTGFTVRPRPGLGGSFQIRVEHASIRTDLPYPTWIEVSGFPAADDVIGPVLHAATLLDSPPRRVDFSLRCRCDDYEPVSLAVASIQPRWTYSWDAFYKPGIDPFARPKLPKNLPFIRYPVYHKGDSPDAYPKRLELQIDVVHTRDDSFLEFQTSMPRRVEKYIDTIGRKCEVWNGPFAERWGL